MAIPIEEGFEMAKDLIAALKSKLPKPFDYHNWFGMGKGDQLRLISQATNHVVSDDEGSKEFMPNEQKLCGLASIIKSHADIGELSLDIIFLQHVGAAVRKIKNPTTTIKQKEGQIKELIHRSIESDDVVDVF